jgi:ubiquinone/menaquinone biosynthesis C-methylase UbiE
MKRLVVPELLDSDSGTPREVADSLADLAMINRRFGGVRTMTALLREVAGEHGLKEISWLDVAGGTGEVASLTTSALARSGVKARPVVLDLILAHLDRSRESVCADALALPFRDNSFDAVGSTLFVHHLAPEELAVFARESLRVARHAFIINDLIRHPAHLALAYAAMPLYRSRLTRHDAPASVRRAYTVDEVRKILKQAGASNITVQNFYLFRMGVIVWKQPAPAPSTI